MILFVFSHSVHAAVSWGGDRNVARIINYDDGSIFLVLEALATEPGPSCENNSWLLISRSHLAFNQMYSAALAALHSGKKLNGYIEGCVTVSGRTYRTVKRLDALP